MKQINVVKQIKESNSNIKIEYLIDDLSKQEDRQKVYNYTKEKTYLCF